MIKFAKASEKILKVPKLISQFGQYFDKLDSKYIESQLLKVYSSQVSMLYGTCIDTKSMKAEYLMQVFKHIITQIGKDNYIKILEATTEDYSIFRSTTSIIATYVFLAEYFIYKKDLKNLEIVYSSYGIYAYTVMFNKRIVICRPDIFEATLSQMHGLNEYAKNYRKGGHIQVITYFVEAELNKLLRLINGNKFNQVVFTRSFSYIKTRINQTIGTFAKIYHKLAKESSRDEVGNDEGITSAQLGLMVKQVLNAHKLVSQLPDQIINALNKETNIDINIVRKFINTEIQLSQHDKTFEELLKQLYESIFKLDFNLIKNICDVKFVAFLKKVITSKRANATIIDIKTKIDKVIKYIIAKTNDPEVEQKMGTLIAIRQARILTIRMLYFIYIQNALCQH